MRRKQGQQGSIKASGLEAECRTTLPANHITSIYYIKRNTPEAEAFGAFRNIICARDYARKPRSIPAATAEPITPATFGPIACINR